MRSSFSALSSSRVPYEFWNIGPGQYVYEPMLYLTVSLSTQVSFSPLIPPMSTTADSSRKLSQREAGIQMMLTGDVHLGTKNCERYIFKRRNNGNIHSNPYYFLKFYVFVI
jgi:hypothetical protein